MTLADGAPLPAGAVVELRLRDLDASGAVVAARTLTPEAQVPTLLFSLSHPADGFAPGRRHAVEARVLAEGALRYRTPSPVPVQDLEGFVELRLDPVPAD